MEWVSWVLYLLHWNVQNGDCTRHVGQVKQSGQWIFEFKISDEFKTICFSHFQNKWNWKFIVKKKPPSTPYPNIIRYTIHTHCALRDLNENFQVINFLANFSDWWLRYLLWNCPQMNVAVPDWSQHWFWWWLGAASHNVYADLYCHMYSLGQWNNSEVYNNNG